MKLDEIIADEPHMNDVNTFEQSFTESVDQASDDMIKKVLFYQDIFHGLCKSFEQRRKCKYPVHLRELNLSIKICE